MVLKVKIYWELKCAWKCYRVSISITISCCLWSRFYYHVFYWWDKQDRVLDNILVNAGAENGTVSTLKHCTLLLRRSSIKVQFHPIPQILIYLLLNLKNFALLQLSYSISFFIVYSFNKYMLIQKDQMLVSEFYHPLGRMLKWSR